jgi:ectoine hydroxylase-related dioxygenase (phytanoyl-CoA dioxygenase family)
MVGVTVDEKGFAGLPRLFDDAEIGELSHRLSFAQLKRSSAGIRHLMGNPDVAAVAHDQRLIAIAHEILRSDAFPFRVTLFDKSAKANWLVTWHQDTALPLRSRKDVLGWGPWSRKHGTDYAHAPTYALEQIVALRVHLDNSGSDNGPLRVLPGTHKLGVLTDDEVFRLSAQRPSMDCIVARGGILAMRPLLIHSSSKCQNDLPRRVLHIEYSSSMTMGDGLELAVA